jgi:hypothetical protein
MMKKQVRNYFMSAISHSVNNQSSIGKCWLLEHCLALIDGQSGFPLTLESLLVIGEVARSNIRVAQPYFQHIVQSVCRKLLADQDSGIQIRCAKALALVGASILQEMEKEDTSKDISNSYFEFVQICHSFCVIRSINFTRRSYPAVDLHNSVWSRRRTTSAFYSSPKSRSLCRSCYCWITNIRVFAGMLF